MDFEHVCVCVCVAAVVCVGSKSVSLLSMIFTCHYWLEHTDNGPHNWLPERSYCVIHAKHYALVPHNSDDCWLYGVVIVQHRACSVMWSLWVYLAYRYRRTGRCGPGRWHHSGRAWTGTHWCQSHSEGRYSHGHTGTGMIPLYSHTFQSAHMGWHLKMHFILLRPPKKSTQYIVILEACERLPWKTVDGKHPECWHP